MPIQRIIRSWQGLNPQTRRSVRRASGLVALVAGLATAGWYLWPKVSNAYTGRNDNVVMGERYALQRVGGCEVVRTVNSDGSLGYVYDVPRGPHKDLDSSYSNTDHIHRENPRAVMVVLDADNQDRCRIVSQPRTLPYKP